MVGLQALKNVHWILLRLRICCEERQGVTGLPFRKLTRQSRGRKTSERECHDTETEFRSRGQVGTVGGTGGEGRWPGLYQIASYC